MASILNATTTSGLVTSADNSGSLQLQTNNGTTAVTIDTSQNVGIGGTPVAVASTKTLTIYDATESRIQLQNSTTGTTSTDGSTIAVAGSDLYINNRENGNQLFFVNGSERMRIDSSGRLLVNTTTSGGWSGDQTVSGVADGLSRAWGLSGYNNTTSNGGAILSRVDNTSRSLLALYYTNATNVGNITTNGTGVTYGTSSDYRLKENIAPMTGALEKVSQLKPVTYTWKSNGSIGQGFIAHELQAVVPDCVIGEKDAVDEEGKPVYQGVDTSFLVATLTAAIQEQQAMIEELKAEVQALKGVA